MRGPATEPSFVTWPTRKVATPLSFATRSSRPAASRTCATDPGAEPMLRRPERLHGVDHAHRRPLALEQLADRFEVGLGEDLDAVAAAEPRGAELHLGDRLLAGDEEGAPVGRDRPERREQERRLADARLAADQHERRGHETAAEHAVELRDAGRDPLVLLRDDVDEAQRRPARGAPPLAALPLFTRRDCLGDHRPELGAAGTAPEPAAGRRPALGAHMLDCCRPRHPSTVAVGPDGISAETDTNSTWDTDELATAT